MYNVDVQTLVVPGDSASYARGKYVAERRGCMGCHGENLGGGEVFLPPGSPVGTLIARNITSGKGGIQYSERDWIRLLRHGVNKKGKSAWFMPSQEVCHLSNQEMAALVCFLKQLPPVDSIMPEKEIKPLGRLLIFFDKFPLFPAELIDHHADYQDSIAPQVTPAYGAYLATSCQGCHSRTYKGNPPLVPGQPPVPDISSSGNVGQWSEAAFLTALRTGKKPDGTQMSDAMPWKYLPYTDDEYKALYAFLHQAQ